MINEQAPRREIAHADSADGSYLDWPAILAGGTFALAISFLLLGFGASLGLSLSSPYRGEGVSAAWLAIAAGIWFAWVMVTSFGAGGYLTGRMRRRAGDATAGEIEVRDGAHGLVVWATGALAGIILAAFGIGGIVSTSASAVGSAAGSVTDVISDAVPSDYFADVMLRNTVQEPVTAASTEVAAPSEAGPAIGPDVRGQIADIITRSVASGELSEGDRSYLVQLVAVNGDMSADEASNRVDEVIVEIDDARATAVAAIEQARVAGVVFGFIATATLLIGSIAAFFAATAGGHHRDAGLGLVVLTARS